MFVAFAGKNTQTEFIISVRNYRSKRKTGCSCKKSAALILLLPNSTAYKRERLSLLAMVFGETLIVPVIRAVRHSLPLQLMDMAFVRRMLGRDFGEPTCLPEAYSRRRIAKKPKQLQLHFAGVAIFFATSG